MSECANRELGWLGAEEIGVKYPEFDSLERMILDLKSRPHVVGLLEYGSRKHTDMSPGGDYDLFVITDDNHRTPASGISFYVNGIPVDCGIRCRMDLDAMVRQRWKPDKCHHDNEIHFDRFAYRHVLDKVKHRIVSDPDYASFILNSNMLWLIETYMSHNNLPKGDYKAAWEHMRINRPNCYALLAEFHRECELIRKYEIEEVLSEQIMIPFGGLWRKDEVFFHLRDESKPLSEEEKHYAISLIS